MLVGKLFHNALVLTGPRNITPNEFQFFFFFPRLGSRAARSGTVVDTSRGGGDDDGEVAALRAAVLALEEEKAALERAKVELEEENRAVEDIVEPLQEENDTLSARVATLERDLDDVVARAGSSEESEKRVRELQAECDALGDARSTAEIRVRELEEELAMVKDNMSDLQATQNTLASELGHMRGSAGGRDEAGAAGVAGAASAGAMQSSRAKVRALEAEVARLKQTESIVEDLTGQLIAAKLELAEVTGDKYVLEQRCKNLTRDVEKYRANAQRLGSQVAQLEIKVESARGQ
jgi:chromosome segregation ATPase